jgi:hypothetical protein
MPRTLLPLSQGRPCVQVVLRQSQTNRPLLKMLLADSGAGSQTSRFELILVESECLSCGAVRLNSVNLGGAYSGTFPTYLLPVEIPTLGFNRYLRAVGVPTISAGFDGIACFRFLNRFTYGNFGDPSQFGLES